MAGTFGEFNPSLEDWRSYNERLQQYFKVNDVAEDKQKAILSSNLPSYKEPSSS